MFTRRKIKRAINLLVEDCSSSDKLASKLEGLGIKGVRDRVSYCPIAIVLQQKTGIKHLRVDSYHVESWYGVHVTLPPPIPMFIERFDKGVYPNLISVEETG